MKKVSKSVKGNSKNGAKSQLRNSREAAGVTKADFKDYLNLREARGRMELAAELNFVAGESAAMMRSLMSELFHIYQLLPKSSAAMQRFEKLDPRVNTLANELECLAEGKICDALTEIVDAGGRAAPPAPPKGLTGAEFALLTFLDEYQNTGAGITAISEHLEGEEDLTALMERLERRGLIAFIIPAGEDFGKWHLAGPLKGGLR